MTIGSILWPLAIYWLVLFAACYAIVEFAQNYLYDETVAGVGWKVTLGSFLLAAMLTWTRSTFDTMFTTELGPTLLQAVLWFGVFTLIYRFQPVHGAAIGIATMLVLSGLVSLAVDSVMDPGAETRPAVRQAAPPPIRRSTRPMPAQTPAAATEDVETEDVETE